MQIIWVIKQLLAMFIPRFDAKYRRRRSLPRRAFTILELLASMTLLILIAGLSIGIVNSLSQAWREQKARLSTFESARVAFETVVSRLSQGTLNTYWDYNDPGNPTRYVRQSELHFVMGRTVDLLGVPEGDTGDYPLDGIFFVAPLGFTQTSEIQPLIRLLNACGFFVHFSEDPAIPSFLNGRISQRYRYRLFQFLQPGENLAIFQNPNSNAWFSENLSSSTFPLAENVIGLVLRASYTAFDAEVVAFEYDSRDFGGNPLDPGPQFHQLPPSISLTMMVIDEDSARRLETIYGVDPPPLFPQSANFFRDVDNFDQSLLDWEEHLANFSPAINFRVFSADIPIRGAKWSSN